ncbi:CDP-glucose 4,6-dehydratase [Treponema brennaborense]|uniref:CDP-glucose 4,6-dehydratase n=1 Tax=Treponema brennaborense (strain DSM 12168 / CIP 105900 / DD5/3) TaxID=906968 RepID=F4LIS0_TREBD|nr:CDP-glucose 4,6-dehydratase [Treponema brennaborense]AEE16245.1 CDP-glucose 4,6-dehydratase [Treponema brennaborense DSM 12168]
MNSLLSFYKNKKIFLTGHTGFKGAWLCRILIAAGADVTGYSSGIPTEPSLFALTKTAEQMNCITADIRNGKKLAESIVAAKPDIVFHLAAQPLVRVSYKDPVETYETNVMGTVHLLEAVRNSGTVKSVVNVTTDKVYKNREWNWGYRENEELCGFDPYSNSKSCSELVTHSYKQSFFSDNRDLAVSTARSGNVIGGGDYALDRIIPDCIRAVESGKDIVIRNPYSTRPYQHVLECLSGYLLLARLQYEDKSSYEGSYNFGPDDSSCVTTGELADMFCRTWGSGAVWKNVAESNAPHEANFLKLDCSSAKNVLGWKPLWDIRTAIKKIVEWEQAVQNGVSSAAVTDNQIKEYFEI